MRLWHKDLIPYLPRQQLLAQWRECCCIAKNIATKGTPNHVLVNKILDYPWYHFHLYTYLVMQEMISRGYKISRDSYQKYEDNLKQAKDKGAFLDKSPYEAGFLLFGNWHNTRYLRQCYYNLQEKFDCGAIPPDEWERIELEWRKEIHA